jgi:putative hemolysin
MAPYAETISFVIIVTIITYFSLVIGELVPKAIALNNPEKITLTLSGFMRKLSIVTYPVVLFLTASTKVFLKIFMIKENTDPPITEEELKYLIDTSSQHGVIEKEEREILHSVIGLGGFNAKNIMTDRSQMVWLDINSPKEKMLEIITENGFSKYPLCDGAIDNVVGMIAAKDILLYYNDLSKEKLKELLNEPLFFSRNTPALKVLDRFKRKKMHTGFVIDEYGGVDGLITLHDLIENVFGDLPDMEDLVEPSMITRDDGSVLIDGTYDIRELKEKLKLDEIPEEPTYNTVGGFIINYFHKIPESGDKFMLGSYKIEIIDMDGHRIDKVLFTKKEDHESKLAS